MRSHREFENPHTTLLRVIRDSEGTATLEEPAARSNRLDELDGGFDDPGSASKTDPTDKLTSALTSLTDIAQKFDQGGWIDVAQGMRKLTMELTSRFMRQFGMDHSKDQQAPQKQASQKSDPSQK